MKTSTVSVLKSLSDETRLSIVQRLARNKCEVAGAEIVSACSEFLKLSQPTMSHHFGKLVQSGVLTERKMGTEKVYQLNRDLLLDIGIDVEKLANSGDKNEKRNNSKEVLIWSRHIR